MVNSLFYLNMKLKSFWIQYLFSILFMINNPLICSTFNLTVIHNNDYHTHYPPININNFDCKSGEECFGGVARTVTKVRTNNSYEVLFLIIILNSLHKRQMKYGMKSRILYF
jgi:2',3'-cyclic-nucleotide 2'-phosphodiesterase (5'-nucleotidase family)